MSSLVASVASFAFWVALLLHALVCLINASMAWRGRSRVPLFGFATTFVVVALYAMAWGTAPWWLVVGCLALDMGTWDLVLAQVGWARRADR